MDDQSAIILVLDASVLINFLAVDRVDLIQAHPAKILVTEHVREEVTRFYPEQVARLDAAISAGIMEVFVIDDPNEIEEMSTLRSKWGEKRLGVGECSAIVAAKRRGYEIAIDVFQRNLLENKK